MWCICAGINAASLEVLSVALGAWINPFIKRYCVFIRIPCTSQTGYMSRHIVFYVGATIRTTSHPCPTKALFTVVTQQFQICLFPGHTGQYRKRPLPSQDSQVPHGYSRPERLRHVEKSDVIEAAIRHASTQNQHSNTLRGSSLQNSHCLSISVPSSQSHVVSTTTTQRVQCHYWFRSIPRDLTWTRKSAAPGWLFSDAIASTILSCGTVRWISPTTHTICSNASTRNRGTCR